MSYAEDLLEGLTTVSTIAMNVEARARLGVLLTDFIVVARAGKIAHGKSTSSERNLGAQLAINSSFHDADDIDWSVITHPGSVIWASLLESIVLNPQYASRFTLAAHAGYRTSASVANFLGLSHRKKWHVTTTAGTLASATTSSVFRDLSKTQHVTSLRSSASNMGGIAIADRRTGAAVFNRASATSLGLLATDFAASGFPTASDIWEGERGLIHLFSISNESAQIFDGVSTTGLRLFPYNGFIQSMVYAISELAKNSEGELLEIHIGINAITRDLANGSVGGNYWNLRHGAASAWQTRDVTRCMEARPDIVDKVVVEAIDIPISGALVTVKTTSGSDSLRWEIAPGLNFGESDHNIWQMAKWDRLIGSDYQLAMEFSSLLLSDSADVKTITSIRDFLL